MEKVTQSSDKGGVAFTFDLDITCKPSEAQKIDWKKREIDMGYCIKMISSEFVMEKENFEKALIALKNVFKEENMTVSSASGRHFNWVSTKAVLNSSTFEEALEEIRYIPIKDENGNIRSLKFTGKKYGDENIFFNAIAPYVKSGYLSFEIEDEDKWAWEFSNGKVEYVSLIKIDLLKK